MTAIFFIMHLCSHFNADWLKAHSLLIILGSVHLLQTIVFHAEVASSLRAFNALSITFPSS